MATFGDIWRMVRLHAPGAPFALVRAWTQGAFEDLCERRPWNFLSAEARLSTLASRSLTLTFTQGSLAITSAAGFVATDAGRQVSVGGFPFYTINQVTSASAAVLDIPYAATGGALTATIQSVYMTMPADFGAFNLVTDPYNQRLFGWWYTAEEIGRYDPNWTSSGDTPRALVAVQPSTIPGQLGQTRYAWWPRMTAAKQYPYWYRKRSPQLADTDVLQGVLAHAGDVLQQGALAKCALWPGTAEYKNPYFSLGVHKQLQDQFDRACATLELRDDDQAQQSWVALPYHHWPVWDLGDTAYLRSHDATVADYRSGAW